MKTSTCFHTFSTTLGMILLPALANAGITTYLSSPGDQNPFGNVDGYDVTDFEGVPPETLTDEVDTPIGTYSGTGTVFTNDEFGAGGEAQYLAVAAGNSVGINLDAATAYFGLMFTAGDEYNTFELRSNGSSVASFTTEDAINTIPNTPGYQVTTIDGTIIDTVDYYGQPDTGDNPSEPYAFFHIIGTEGTTFDELVISQGSGAGSARFESDNHTVGPVPDIIPPNWVPVVPEPSSLLLGLMGAGALFRRRRA